MTGNPYEKLHRLEKAAKLADVLHAGGILAADLEQCRPSSEVWTAAAQQAGVKPPSVLTCAVVCEMLYKREKIL